MIEDLNFKNFKDLINNFEDFPKKGINFKNILPILENPKSHKYLISQMANSEIVRKAEAIIGIDARGFIFASGIALEAEKPLILARKPGKLPGELISKSYDLEYGSNSLSLQKSSLDKYNSYLIVDDLLATGGTVKCVSDILKDYQKSITGLSVVVVLKDLNGESQFNFPVESQVVF